jgi:hypothetical protein
MASPVEQRLIEQIRRMDPDQQQTLLDYAHALSRPRGLSGEEMIRLAREVDFPPGDLKEMAEAIEEGCEDIDWDGWDLPA